MAVRLDGLLFLLYNFYWILICNLSFPGKNYFEKIFKVMPDFFKEVKTSKDGKTFKQLVNYLLNIGEMLDFDVKELYIELSNIKVQGGIWKKKNILLK